MRLLLIINLFIFSQYAVSAIPNRTQMENKKTSNYIESGQFYGGETGSGFSLLKIRRKLSKAKTVDRIIFDFGDLYLKPLKNKIPYLHVSIDKAGRKILVDMYQTHRIAMEERALVAKLKSSPYIKFVDMIYDSTSGDLSLVLNLKKSARVEAFMMPSKSSASRLVLDLADPGATKKQAVKNQHVKKNTVNNKNQKTAR